MFSKCTNTVTLLILLSLLLGCSPQFTPVHNPALAEPELKAASFISFDGTELPIRSWLPAGGIKQTDYIFIAVHGFNDYANFIKAGAEFFTRHKIAVFAYDQRGFGKAPIRGMWSSTAAMAGDLQTLIRLIGQDHPDLPLYLLGHSMGGAVVIQAMAGENHPEVAGAILVAPAVWARSTMPFYQYGALWLVSHTIPWYRVTGDVLDRQACSNIEALRELDRDPLVIKKTRLDTIYGLQDLMDRAYAGAENFSLPTLVLYGRHDEIIPPQPVFDVFQRFRAGSAPKRLILYNNGYHMLLRDLQAEHVMADIVAWVSNNTVADR